MTGKRALITGAAHGIGEQTALALAQRGWSLALVDLDLAGAEAVAERCGGRARAFAADITDQEAVDAAVAGAVEAMGGLDLVFANAGFAVASTVRHLDPEIFAVQVDVNLVGTYRTVHACLPHLIDSSGYALLNASASALLAPPGLAAYGATKAGVESLGDTLRREVKHLGVDVGVVYLLWVATDLVEGAEGQSGVFAAVRSNMKGPLAKTMPVSRAVDQIVKGIERRSRRVMAPSLLRGLFRMRGLIGGPIERDALNMAPAVEAASLADSQGGLGFEGAMRDDTPAAAAAVEKVKARR